MNKKETFLVQQCLSPLQIIPLNIHVIIPVSFPLFTTVSQQEHHQLLSMMAFSFWRSQELQESKSTGWRTDLVFLIFCQNNLVWNLEHLLSLKDCECNGHTGHNLTAECVTDVNRVLPLIGCQFISRPSNRSSRYLKWLNTS